MEKPLRNTPNFDEKAFRDQVQAWKRSGAGQRVIVEWSTGTGPSVFVYPAGNRAAGVRMIEDVEITTSDERWADFLEFEYVPKIAQALRQEDLGPDVICVDLRPLVVQRARRRQIEAAAKAKTG
jgi:hypothetical protein